MYKLRLSELPFGDVDALDGIINDVSLGSSLSSGVTLSFTVSGMGDDEGIECGDWKPEESALLAETRTGRPWTT